MAPARTAAIALTASALTLGAGTPGASATRTVAIASSVSVHANGLTFSGKVGSSNAACRQDRRVTLYRTLSGGGHQALETVTTGVSGKWKVKVPGSAGISMAHFYAKAKRRSEGTAGTIYVCKSARSRTIGL
jgi:hypothetical protein